MYKNKLPKKTALLDKQEFPHSGKTYVDLTTAMAAPTQAESAGFSPEVFSASVVGKCGSKQLFEKVKHSWNHQGSNTRSM